MERQSPSACCSMLWEIHSSVPRRLRTRGLWYCTRPTWPGFLPAGMVAGQVRQEKGNSTFQKAKYPFSPNELCTDTTDHNIYAPSSTYVHPHGPRHHSQTQGTFRIHCFLGEMVTAKMSVLPRRDGQKSHPRHKQTPNVTSTNPKRCYPAVLDLRCSAHGT